MYGMNIDMCAILRFLSSSTSHRKTRNFKRIALVKLAERGFVIVGKRTYLTKVGKKVARVLKTADAYDTYQSNPYMG
jgi:hypothetical protein